MRGDGNVIGIHNAQQGRVNSLSVRLYFEENWCENTPLAVNRFYVIAISFISLRVPRRSMNETNLLGYAYKIYNSDYNIEMINKQHDAEDPL